MKTLRLCAALSLAVSLFAQDVAPPPRPADNRPTLAATLQFIQEQLTAIGPVNYISYGHDNRVGNDWTNKFIEQITNVRVNVPACRIDYHFRETREGQVTSDAELGILLRDVSEVVVKSREQDLRDKDSKAGHPEWTSRIEPPVFNVGTRRKVGTNDFNFYDESVANRVAKALVHAVELCGGGSKDPF